MTQHHTASSLLGETQCETFADIAHRLSSPAMLKDFKGYEQCLPHRVLKRHPHIVEQMLRLWGTAKAASYLEGLVVTQRPDRMGFDFAVISEIFFVQQVHDHLYPSSSRRVEDLLHQNAKPRTLQELVYGFAQTQARVAAAERKAPPKVLTLRQTGWGEIDNSAALRGKVERPTRPSRAKLGEILVAAGVVSEGVLQQALKAQSDRSEMPLLIGEILNARGAISAEDVTKALCLQKNFLLLNLDKIPMTVEAAAVLSASDAREHSAIPVLRVGETVVVALEEPLLARSAKFILDLEESTGLTIQVAWAPASAVASRLKNYVPGRIGTMA